MERESVRVSGESRETGSASSDEQMLPSEDGSGAKDCAFVMDFLTIETVHFLAT